ncbi:MAG: DUF1232 domain-containing protein [Synergistaceae bacterium]|nr:DUF1232 domain-containing protein [Synergistaceae bacterium]
MSNEIHSVDDIDPKYAKDYSEDSFWDKIKGVLKSAGLPIIYKALQLYYAMDNPNCPMGVKAGIIAALGYFISPIDLIPDFIPVLGFTDDLAAIGAAIVMAHMYIDEDVKRKARMKIDDIFGAGTSAGLEDDGAKKQVASESSSRREAMEDLKTMKELLDMGAITQEEFDRKKDELMSRI